MSNRTTTKEMLRPMWRRLRAALSPIVQTAFNEAVKHPDVRAYLDRCADCDRDMALCSGFAMAIEDLEREILEKLYPDEPAP